MNLLQEISRKYWDDDPYFSEEIKNSLRNIFSELVFGLGKMGSDLNEEDALSEFELCTKKLNKLHLSEELYIDTMTRDDLIEIIHIIVERFDLDFEEDFVGAWRRW